MEENFLRAYALGRELWDMTDEAIQNGELDAPKSMKDAFIKGVVSVLALMDSQWEKVRLN